MAKKKTRYEAPKSLNLSGVAQGACNPGNTFTTAECSNGSFAGMACAGGSNADGACNPTGQTAIAVCKPGGIAGATCNAGSNLGG